MDIKYGLKVKSIKRELRRRLEDWVATIADPALQRLVKRDTIVTGGSIASMLMGDRINDVDVYFRNKATVVAVAKYYVEQFAKMHANKLAAKFTAGYTPEVKETQIANCKGVVEDRVIVYIKSAGVVAEDMDEYKYFEMYPAQDTEDFAESLIKEAADAAKPKYRPLFISQNSITLSQDIQIVVRFFGSPAEIHNNYDFEHAKCYYDWHEDELVTPESALLAMMSRTLIYNGSLYPICSIFRMKKFLERGWRITAGQQLKIMWQINELNLKDIQQLNEQLMGVDAAYMWQLLEALKKVDPSKIDSTYIAAIIDRIFE